MELEQSVVRVQAAYPRIYLACHTRHQNARSTADKISQRDGSLLAHLDEARAVAQSDLARHMSVAKSTLSEALAGLEECGYVAREGGAIRRTAKGTAAMSNGSVLEPERLRAILEMLTVEERQRAVEGLELIALGAERLSEVRCQ
jgi:DNA-binding MarR family transcriptional regulator